jgi:hypothetical protein
MANYTQEYNVMEDFMQILVIILTIIVFTKTLSYGIYELNTNNKLGGITVIVFSVISLIAPNLIVYIKGI